MNRTVRPLFLLLLADLSLSLTGCPDKGDTSDGGGGARHRLGITANRYIPNSWQVPAWFIDPANSTGCASDSNNGTSATCSGAAGPLLTWHHLNDELWGCESAAGGGCPRLQQSTTITFLSSHPDATDPVYFYPAIENQAVVQLVGALGSAQQIATGVLSNVTAKNRSTPQLLLAQSGATAVNQLVVNATHASRAWTYKLSSGSIYSMTEPSVAVTIPGGCGAGVDTWANGDTVTVYQPVSVNIVDVGAKTEQLSGANSNYVVYLYNLNIYGPGSFDNAFLSNVYAMEMSTARYVTLFGSAQFGLNECNSVFNNGVRTAYSSVSATFNGGALGSSGQNTVLSNSNLVNDVIVGGGTSIGGITNLVPASGPAYIDTGKVLTVLSAFNGSAGIWWGPGTINVAGGGRFLYASTATANLLVGALQLNGGTTGNSVFTSSNVDTVCGGITVNKANLDAAASATCASTGFGGLAYNLGGGAFAVSAL